MAKTIGVVVAGRVIAGLIVDHKIVHQSGMQVSAGRPTSSEIQSDADGEEEHNHLRAVPASELCEMIADQVGVLAGSPTETKDSGKEVEAVGIAMPGIVRDGVLEDSPNVPQLKGAKVAAMVQALLKARGLHYSVALLNDADATAAGIAAVHGKLDHLVRVWTIGDGIGFGRFPYTGGPWEGGHSTVSLDPKENYCGCGGRGHLEGIMGHRAMRLRFLDMEPDEIFSSAKAGDKRCCEFVELWHRAIAAATATQIHLEGSGRFYYTGRDIGRLDLKLLRQYLDEMVKMSPLQSSTIEVLPENRTYAVIGAGAAALHELQ
jgi:predicted NBD/HSP70 family sugar kinase